MQCPLMSFTNENNVLNNAIRNVFYTHTFASK